MDELREEDEEVDVKAIEMEVFWTHCFDNISKFGSTWCFRLLILDINITELRESVCERIAYHNWKIHSHAVMHSLPVFLNPFRVTEEGPSSLSTPQEIKVSSHFSLRSTVFY